MFRNCPVAHCRIYPDAIIVSHSAPKCFLSQTNSFGRRNNLHNWHLKIHNFTKLALENSKPRGGPITEASSADWLNKCPRQKAGECNAPSPGQWDPHSWWTLGGRGGGLRFTLPCCLLQSRVTFAFTFLHFEKQPASFIQTETFVDYNSWLCGCRNIVKRKTDHCMYQN